MKVAIALFTVLTIAGCDKESRHVTLARAERDFTEGHYHAALDAFVDLIPTQGIPATIGAGWCEVRLGDYNSAANYFEQVSSDSMVDANAGWAFALWGLNDPAGAIQKSDVALTLDPDFVLSLDPRVTASTLHWVVAASYLQLSDYIKCIESIQKLEPSFAPNPADPNIANILLAKLESLGGAQP
ncbi:MAG: hypothetical protein KDC45_01810 [Bacteroidetes bacterium]|nr:hypothetical protein [Bacteroidota bacterium]